MAIINISGTINSSFSTSGVVVNAAQAAGDVVFTIDLRPTNPIIIVQDNLDYGVLGWDINDAVAVITLVGPLGDVYRNEDYDTPDIIPATSRYLNKTITLPLDPLTDYANILKGNYTLKISWYNSVLDEYYAFLDTYQYNMDPPTIANTTVSGPYTGVLTSTDTTEYGNDVHQIIREHRIQYPTQLAVPPADVVSSNEEVQVTPIYTNEWTILINSFVEYRMADTLRVYWEGSGEFAHCVFGGCIGAMYDAINTMLETYKEAMACNLNDQEAYQKRLVIVNTAWHLLNEAYWSGDTDEADAQSYVIQEMVEYSGGGVCGGSTSELVTPCPPWTGGGVGGVYTFSNALVEAAGNVTWGGSLVHATTVNMIGYEVLFSGSDAGNSVSQSVSASGGILQKASDGATEGRVYIEQDTVTLELADISTPANTRGYEIGATGIIEKADYTGSYVDRQLVAKDYVDLAISGISSYTFGNGLTENGGTVTVGDNAMTNDIIFVSEAAHRFDLQFADSASYNGYMDFSIRYNLFQWVAYNSGSFDAGFLSTASNTYGRTWFYSGLDIGTIGRMMIDLRTDEGMIITDNINNKGLENAADYSGQWTDHSLVTKKWVEDNFVPITGSGTFAGLTDTPGSYTGFGGYFVRVNTAENALEYVVAAFVPASGGIFTGQVTIATSTDRPLVLQQIGSGSIPGTPEGGLNIISFRDNEGDEQGYVGIDASGNVVFKSWVTGAGVLVDDNLEVNGNIIVTGTAMINGLLLDAAETYVVGINTTSGVLSYRTVGDLNAYTNATPMPEAVGGYEVGTTFTAQTTTEMLDGLLYPYQYPAFTSFVMSGQATTLECGVEIASGTKTWTWGTTNDGNIETNSIDVDDLTTPESIIADTANDGTENGAISSAITKTTTNTTHVFQISAQNNKLETFTRNFTVIWYSPFYYGVGAAGLTVAQIQALTKVVVGPGNKSYAFSPTSQVQYIAYPTSYGDLTSILDGNGFETIGDWTLTVESFTNNPPDYEGAAVNYNVYEFDNLTSLGQTYQFIF